MANEQRLGEFISNLLDDLESGAITPEEAIAASSQYEYIRTLLSQRAEDLADATTIGDEALKETLTSIFSQTKSRLGELPAFSSQTPDIIRDEKQTRDTATLEHFAFETLRKETKARESQRKQTRQEFIHTLVTKYSSRANVQADEKAMDSVLDRALSKSSKEQSSQEAQQRFVKEISTEIGVDGGDLEKSLGLSGTKTIVGSWKDAQMEKQALTTLFTHPDLIRPDVVVDAFIHASDQTNLVDVSTHSVKLAQTAGAVSLLGAKAPRIKGPFFSSSNAKGATKGVQQAADGILSLVGEPLREIILKEKINGTLRSIITNSNQLADRLGEKFIHSSVFGYVTQNVFKGAIEKPVMSQSTAIFGDVFGSVFRGPFDYATVQGAKENLYNYFELARASSNAPKGFSFLGPNIMPWHLGSMVSPQRRRSGESLPSLGLGAFGTLGGNAIATMFDRFVGFAFAGPSIAGQLRASRRAAAIPIPLVEDLPTLIAVFVVSVLILFFIFPSFLNIPQLSMASKMSALLSSLSLTDEVTSSNSNGWPVKCGCISQGPDEGTHSTSHLNAIDFLFTKCSQKEHVGLFATADGKVTEVSKTYSVGEKCTDLGGGRWDCHGKSTYGNYVKITLADGQVELYGHMATISVSMGAHVTKGQQIGTSDHNGVTTIEHLHFEILGGTGGAHPLLNGPNKVLPEPGKNNLCVGV